MSRLQPARGTAELLPDSMAKHRLVIDAARTASARYGFQEMATPIFEFSEVFSRPLGESSDIVTKENYSFADRGGEILTLRPENTAGVVRAMISGGLTQSLPLKYFYAGPMFRYERPQKGRMRQFHQVGIEYLGPNDALADAEIIACGARFLASLGVLDDCELHLNSLGDSKSRTAYRAALIAYLETFADQLSDDSKTRLAVNPLRILDSKDAGDCAILQDAPRLKDYLNDFQISKFAGTPNMVLQFAHHIRDLIRERAKFEPIITAQIMVSMNGREYVPMLDSKLNLSQIDNFEPAYNWVNPEKP